MVRARVLQDLTRDRRLAPHIRFLGLVYVWWLRSDSLWVGLQAGWGHAKEDFLFSKRMSGFRSRERVS